MPPHHEDTPTPARTHPALAGIRASILVWFASFGHERGGPVTHAIPARMALMAYPIRLADPQTKRYPDGT